MDVHLTEAQQQVQEAVKAFCARHVDPFVAQWDKDEHFPLDVFRKMGEEGYLGIPIPEAYGGAGESFEVYIAALEQLSRHDAGFACAYAVHLSAHALSILEFGTEAQKQQYLPGLANGSVLGAFALTEPHCGSDAAALRCKAEKDGDHYVLTGTKQWITNAKSAGLFLLFARTDAASSGPKGITAFLIESGTPGLVIDRKTHKMGMRSSETYDVVLDGCRVHESQVLGVVGEGFKIAMKTLDGGRIGIAAQALGIAQACLDEARTFANQREAFGQPIARFQAIQWKVADMAKNIWASRALTYQAASLKAAGKPVADAGAKAKLFASRTAREAANEALQIHGGYGYTDEFPVERHYRDAKVTEIYEGTSEIQRIVISRGLVGSGKTKVPVRA
ncbi:MAG: acyl-CoA dehydrogenase family protein [Candidatus Sericytochromatia bacterium]|nr:acyl-CoA dehydrogenase family protein [Candidatus Sericytochromatia bacterium]